MSGRQLRNCSETGIWEVSVGSESADSGQMAGNPEVGISIKIKLAAGFDALKNQLGHRGSILVISDIGSGAQGKKVGEFLRNLLKTRNLGVYADMTAIGDRVDAPVAIVCGQGNIDMA